MRINHLHIEYVIDYLPKKRRTCTIVFIHAKLLNELESPIAIGYVLKLIKFASEPEQRGLSSSIRLEVVRMNTGCLFTIIVESI